MLTNPLQEVLQEIEEFTDDEKIQLITEVAKMLCNKKPKLHRITELEGLGKELCQEIDVDKYIEEERNSWDREEE